MPNVLLPKKLFQSNDTVKKELATVVHSDNFQFALSFALSEYAMNNTPTAEELEGARQFVYVLMNLASPEEKIHDVQVKMIDHSVLQPRRPEPPKTK